jgi:hypothetical protein
LRPTLSIAYNAGTVFVARLNSGGNELSPVQLLPNSPQTVGPIAANANGSSIFANSQISQISFASLGRVVFICDASDDAAIVSVAPGELLTLYGSNLAPQGVPQQAPGYPTSFNGVSITFNGIAAPLLYTSGDQINLQVPYEIGGQTQVTMQVTSNTVSPPVSESYILAVVPRQPSVFRSDTSFEAPLFDLATCNSQSIAALQPLAIDVDGSVNSCSNPAARGFPGHPVSGRPGRNDSRAGDRCDHSGGHSRRV